jgi:DUF4097 and DUF4098 domain-containing protein YvlB
MRRGMAVALSAVILLLVCGYSDAGWGKEIHKTFGGITAVELSSVSGDCVIKTHDSDEVIVDLFYDVDPEGAMTYEFRESGKTLIIEERWERKGSSSGRVIWTLTVPAETEIEFTTASGDITASGLSKSIEASTASGDIDLQDMDAKAEISTASGDARLVNLRGRIDISTASGDIHIEKSGGEIELATASGDITATGIDGEIELGAASGDIEISNSKGIFDISCASGEIEADGIAIKGASEFSVASGDVEVTLMATSEFDLELSSASGDVLLDYNGNPVKGHFEFISRKGRGRITCPFDFEDEEEFEEHDHTYVRKSFSMKGEEPVIQLHTATGKAVLKK